MSESLRCLWCQCLLKPGQFVACSYKHAALHRARKRTTKAQHQQDVWATAGKKRCAACKEDRPFPLDYYAKRSAQPTRRDRYDSICKTCRNKRASAYQKNNQHKVLAWRAARKDRGVTLRYRKDCSYKKFNASATAYDLQFLAQHGKCAICLRSPGEGERRFAFDHDHDNGVVRGVLCSTCNSGLGLFYDNPELLLGALQYLAYWRQQHGSAEGTNG